MTEVKLHIPIGAEDENRWMAMWGEQDTVFSTETLDKIFNSNPDDSDIRFNIHCDGGSVYEGLAIYDKLRTSGKNIFMNVEGGCHSMAVILLLAAPKENRTANANCRALIHEVQVPVDSYMLSTSELRSLQDQAQREQNTILDIYAERTGQEREILETLMSEEKVRTAAELIQYGFISSINSYNTNQKKKEKMSKQTKNAVLNKVDGFLKGIKNLLDGAVNYDFTDEDGTVVFSTEKEDDSLEVGDVATPDGTFELPDGRTVTIADGVVTEVLEKEEDVEEDTEEVEALTVENAKLRTELQNAVNLLGDLRNELGSTYKPKSRTTNARQVVKGTKSASDLKNEMRENRANWKGGKK